MDRNRRNAPDQLQRKVASAIKNAVLGGTATRLVAKSRRALIETSSLAAGLAWPRRRANPQPWRWQFFVQNLDPLQLALAHQNQSQLAIFDGGTPDEVYATAEMKKQLAIAPSGTCGNRTTQGPS
ncbi:hypothetical protein ACVDG8_011790 [Mesorhizobium sp. ORM8.1]